MNNRLRQLMEKSGYPAPELAARCQTAVLLASQELATLIQELVDHRIPASSYPERIRQYYFPTQTLCVYPHCVGGECGTHCYTTCHN